MMEEIIQLVYLGLVFFTAHHPCLRLFDDFFHYIFYFMRSHAGNQESNLRAVTS